MSELITSISHDELKKYIINQINYFFPDGKFVDYDDLEFNEAFAKALQRTEFCFKHIILTGYWIVDNNNIRHPYFQHTNSDQYCVFLYFLSNSLWKICPDKSWISDKLILLNKMLHCCWYTYKVNLPDIFFVVHPVGSIIGHAIYSNYLVICQNVTIGERRYTTNPIGEFCFLGGGATIIGDEQIGKNVSIGNTTVFRQTIPDNSVCYTDKYTGKFVIAHNKKTQCRAEIYFNLK